MTNCNRLFVLPEGNEDMIDIGQSYSLEYHGSRLSQTALLVALWKRCAQSVPRKVVDLDHFFLWRTNYLDYAYWYLNESSLYEASEYVMIILN